MSWWKMMFGTKEDVKYINHNGNEVVISSSESEEKIIAVDVIEKQIVQVAPKPPKPPKINRLKNAIGSSKPKLILNYLFENLETLRKDASHLTYNGYNLNLDEIRLRTDSDYSDYDAYEKNNIKCNDFYISDTDFKNAFYFYVSTSDCVFISWTGDRKRHSDKIKKFYNQIDNLNDRKDKIMYLYDIIDKGELIYNNNISKAYKILKNNGAVFKSDYRYYKINDGEYYATTHKYADNKFTIASFKDWKTVELTDDFITYLQNAKIEEAINPREEHWEHFVQIDINLKQEKHEEVFNHVGEILEKYESYKKLYEMNQEENPCNDVNCYDTYIDFMEAINQDISKYDYGRKLVENALKAHRINGDPKLFHLDTRELFDLNKLLIKDRRNI